MIEDIKWVLVSELKPNPKNNNIHTPEQIERLAKIIKYQGVRSPIIVSKRSGFMTKGHATLEAIKSLGMSKAPVSYQNYEDETQEFLHMELDPIYIDVILQRWADFTGKDPVRDDGVKWSELNEPLHQL